MKVLKVKRILQINDIVSKKCLLKTLRELILSLETKRKEKMFITIKKNYCRIYDLLHEAEHYKETSIITTYLAAFLCKYYKYLIFKIFNLFYQDLAINNIQKDSIPLCKYKK